MSQFLREDSQGSIDFVSNGDVILEADRNQDGVGDLVFKTGGVERARIAHDGTGTGWPNVLGGSITPYDPPGSSAGIIARLEQWRERYGMVRWPSGVPVCLTLNDATSAEYATVYPLLLSRSIPATSFVITSKIGTTGYMTSAQILEEAENGIAIGSHSVTHGSTPTDNATWQSELADSRTALQALNLLAPSFALPGGWNTNLTLPSQVDGTAIGTYLRENYAGANLYLTDDQDMYGHPMPLRRRYGVNAVQIATVAGSKTAYIDRAIQNGHGLLLVCDSQFIDGSGDLSLTDLTALLDYLVTQQSAGLIDLVTFEGFCYGQQGTPVNKIRDGNFAQALGQPWFKNVGTGAVIDAGAGENGANAVNVASTNTVAQKLTLHKGTTSKITARVANAVGGGGATAKINVSQYAQSASSTSSGAQVGTTRAHTLACTDAYQTMTCLVHVRGDAGHIMVELLGVGGPHVHFTNVQIVQV